MTIMEAAGLTPEEVEAFVAAGWDKFKYTDPANIAAKKVAIALRLEYEATRPLTVGDTVTIPWQQERYTIIAVDGDECWVVDSDGDHLTLRLDTCEHTK